MLVRKHMKPIAADTVYHPRNDIRTVLLAALVIDNSHRHL